MRGFEKCLPLRLGGVRYSAGWQVPRVWVGFKAIAEVKTIDRA